jgi:hypothetical protein
MRRASQELRTRSGAYTPSQLRRLAPMGTREGREMSRFLLLSAAHADPESLGWSPLAHAQAAYGNLTSGLRRFSALSGSTTRKASLIPTATGGAPPREALSPVHHRRPRRAGLGGLAGEGGAQGKSPRRSVRTSWPRSAPFKSLYAPGGSGANAMGKCISKHTHAAAANRANAAKACKAEMATPEADFRAA